MLNRYDFFYVIEGLAFLCIIGIEFLRANKVEMEFSKKSLLIYQ